MHLELLGVVADQRRLESVAILRAEIVDCNSARTIQTNSSPDGL
jgi:hypothetical protein